MIQIPTIHRSTVPGLLAVLISSGCVNGPSADPSAETDLDEDNAFTLVSSLDFASLPMVFQLPNESPFTVTAVTEEYDASGKLVARSREIYDEKPSGSRTLRSREMEVGEFSSGMLSFLASDDSIRPSAGNALKHLIPDRPAFTELKLREQFTYRMAADTSVSGEDSRLVVVRAHVSPDQQPIRHARVAVARRDSAILYLLLERINRSIFYDEVSGATVEMARTSADGVSPHRLYVDVSIDLPLEPARRFTLSETYSPGQPGSATSH